MNDHRRPCPDLVDLLLYFLGLLRPDDDAAHVRRRQRAGESKSPSPHAPKARDEREWSPVDRAVGAAIRRGLSRLLPRLLPSAAAICTLILGIALSMLRSVPVDADQLLREAVLTERAQPMTRAADVLVRYTPDGPGQPVSFVQHFGFNGRPGIAASRLPSALTRLLESYHFNWGRPLSVEPFATWRTSHACNKQDRVMSDVRDTLQTLRTTTPDGELREAELAVEANTHRVVRQTLMFPGVGRLDFEALAPEAPSYAPTRPSRVVPIAPRPSREELDRAALRALLVLGQTGLDMRADVRVSRTPEAVRVEGMFTSPAQRRSAGQSLANIRQLLAEIKHVQIEFHEPALSNTGAAQGVTRTAVPKPGLGRWVNRTFGDHDARASFVPDLTRAIETVRQRLGRLAALGRDYPHARDQLSPAGLTLFQQVVDLHYGKLCTEMTELRMRISAVAGTVTVAQGPLDPTADVVSRAPVALGHATALERQVQLLLTHKDLAPTEQDHVRTTFQALWETVRGPRSSQR